MTKTISKMVHNILCTLPLIHKKSPLKFFSEIFEQTPSTLFIKPMTEHLTLFVQQCHQTLLSNFYASASYSGWKNHCLKVRPLFHFLYIKNRNPVLAHCIPLIFVNRQKDIWLKLLVWWNMTILIFIMAIILIFKCQMDQTNYLNLKTGIAWSLSHCYPYYPSTLKIDFTVHVPIWFDYKYLWCYMCSWHLLPKIKITSRFEHAFWQQ